MTLLWLIPILPLAGAAINGAFGKHFSKVMVAAVALVSTALSFAYACFATWPLLSSGTRSVEQQLGSWLRVANFDVQYGFLLDHLSAVMVLVVTGVGFLIHVYSVAYMEHEGGYYRYFAYLNLFMFFMLTLVLANNYLLMFVGWEGVGLASYLLIGFFFPRESAANAGKKAFITNRIGDFGFLIALFLLIKHFGTLQYADVFQQVAHLSAENTAGVLTAVGLLMLVGATGKSAQIPLYVWLPDAMEGPTPVSALIHAATMVTAGVYMVCRSNPIFSRAPIALLAVAIIGTLTCFFAATIGIAQTDIKRVLAYSTISQLGYMFMAAGVAAYSAAVFHLMTHAFFKALLFLGAGSVIHGLGGEQDMRRMGGLRKYMPWTFWTMTLATCAIAGFPLFSGFFSKDEILWQAFSSPHGSKIFWAVGVITAFITAFYMFRLWFMTFFGEYRGANAVQHVGHEAQQLGTPGSTEHAEHTHRVPMGGQKTVASAPSAHVGHHGSPHESPWVMVAPLAILAVLSVVGGYVGVPKALHGGNQFEHFLAPVMPTLADASARTQTENVLGQHAAEPQQEQGQSSEESGTELALTGVSTVVAFGGFGLAYLLYYKRRDLPEKMAASAHGLYKAVVNKYWIDELYGAVFVRPLLSLSRVVLWRDIDEGAFDTTVNESATGVRKLGDMLRGQQSGNIRSYAGWVAAGAAIVMIYMVVVASR